MSEQFFKHPTVKYDHLIGLPFEHGKQDCYTMAQRIFADNTPITLSDYARPDDWWLMNEDLYANNFKNEGFMLMDEVDLMRLRPLDSFLVCIPDLRDKRDTHKTNHCAIYVGDGMVIHHRLGMLSEVIPYRGLIRQMTTHVLRHKDVPEMKLPVTTIDIMEKILPHKRERILKALRAKSKS